MLTPLPVWIIGDAADGTRNFLVRTAAPRFLAEIFEADDDAPLLAPLSFALADGRQLANFQWIDPAPADYVPLLRQAENALRDYDDMTDFIEDEGD